MTLSSKRRRHQLRGLGAQSSGVVITNGTANGGRVIIIAREPVLDLVAGTPLQLTFYGLPGTNYSLLASTNLAVDPGAQSMSFTLSNRFTTLVLSNTSSSATFYRAVQH